MKHITYTQSIEDASTHEIMWFIFKLRLGAKEIALIKHAATSSRVVTEGISIVVPIDFSGQK